MARIKVHRISPALDMTPMVDLAFLLVTFFMLTTTFSPDEPAIETPTSTSELILPDVDILTISISKEGTIYFSDREISSDSLRNELGDWIVASRVKNPNLRVAIKGDKDANYKAVEKVITTLVEKNVTRFNLVTDSEKES